MSTPRRIAERSRTVSLDVIILALFSHDFPKIKGIFYSAFEKIGGCTKLRFALAEGAILRIESLRHVKLRGYEEPLVALDKGNASAPMLKRIWLLAGDIKKMSW